MLIKCFIKLILITLFITINFSCSNSADNKPESKKDGEPEYIVTRRDDGTLSGICQVDSAALYHGLSKAYYADGKIVHSTLNYNHGVKDGLSTKYYKNGQISQYTNYMNGRKHGQSRKYYKNGSLKSITDYENGNVLPGLKEYQEDGTLVADYPTIEFREIDHLESHNRIDLEISCSKKSDKVNFYLLGKDKKVSNKVFLISENGSLTRKFYVRPGQSMDAWIHILVEIPTDFDNVMSQQHSYHLSATN